MRMADPGLTFEGLKAKVGQELGVSRWLTVDQERIDRFAECTEDHQWIHVDIERTKKESPFRAPIAHGCLTLSLVPALALELDVLPENTKAAFNYGLDRVRFVTPVIVGARVRLRATLTELDEVGPGQYMMKASNTIEIEGLEKPALVADTLIMIYEDRKKRCKEA
jgi:acyl dehydratase